MLSQVHSFEHLILNSLGLSLCEPNHVGVSPLESPLAFTTHMADKCNRDLSTQSEILPMQSSEHCVLVCF